MTQNDKRFFDAFSDHMGQYALTLAQFLDFLAGHDDRVPSETYSALADAYNLWREALRGV